MEQIKRMRMKKERRQQKEKEWLLTVEVCEEEKR